jgi:GAF domain-containing protein
VIRGAEAGTTSGVRLIVKNAQSERVSLEARTPPARVAATGETSNIPDLRVWNAAAPSIEAQALGQHDESGRCPALFVPLTERSGTVSGVLGLLTPRDGDGQVVTFDATVDSFMTSLAAQAAAALHNARSLEVRDQLESFNLVQETNRKLKETEALLAASRAVSSTLDIGTLLRHFLRRVATVLDADGVGSYLLDRDGEWLVPLQGYRLPPDRLETLRALRLSIVQHAFYAEGVRSRRPVFSSDAMNDQRIPAVIRQAVPHTSELFVPIVTQGRVVGGLIAAWWDRSRDFSENDLALIEAIATHAGVVLANVRLFQEDRRQRKDLSVVNALSRAVTGELDRRTLIEALYAQLTLVFDARDLIILLRGTVEGEVLVALSIRDGERESASFDRYAAHHVGLAAVLLDTGMPVRTADYARACAQHGVDASSNSRSHRYWLGVPMTVGDTVIGVVALGSDERAFTEADERLLTNIGQLAAVALASARLFEERERAYSELYLLSLITGRALRRWREGTPEVNRDTRHSERD